MLEKLHLLNNLTQISWESNETHTQQIWNEIEFLLVLVTFSCKTFISPHTILINACIPLTSAKIFSAMFMSNK